MQCKKLNKKEYFGEIELELENNFVNYCEDLSGKIKLNITKAFPGNKVNILLFGNEFCLWNEVLAHGVFHHSGRHRFFESKITIAKFKTDWIPIGEYKFFFSIKLTENLLNSFNFQEAKIYYEAFVECNNEKNEYNNVFYDVKKFSFNSKLTGTDDIVETKNILLKNFCCCNYGFAHFTFKIDKDYYFPGENMKILLEIDHSQAKLSSKTIEIQIERIVKMISDNNMKNIFTDILSQLTIEGHNQGQATTLKEIDILIPDKLERCPTIIGKKFTCQYYLIIKSQTKTKFKTNYPKFKREIKIGNDFQLHNIFDSPVHVKNTKYLNFGDALDSNDKTIIRNEEIELFTNSTVNENNSKFFFSKEFKNL